MNPERTIGETLRLAREAKALTLEEVCEKTRISLSVLHALERDRFSELPGPIYVKNHIRVLSELFDLDRDSLLDRYQEAVSGEKIQPEKEAVWSEEKVREFRLQGWRPGRNFWIGLAAIALVMLVWIWAPWRSFHRRSGTALDSPVRKAAEVAPALPLADFPFLPDGVEGSAAPEPAKVLALRIEAAGPARVLVNVDDRRNLYRSFGSEGGIWTLEGEAAFFLSALGVDALSLSLDGEALILPKTPGDEISGWRIDAASAGGAH